MGLFSGGFFGGGTDESSSSTTTTTTVQTTNTTRDIGLTGEAAVALADVVTGAGVELVKDFDAGLFSFANALVDANRETTRLQKEYEGKFVQYQDQQVQKVLDASFENANPEVSSIKDVAIIGAIAMGIMVIFLKGGK